MADQRKTIYDAILELSAAFAREGLAPPKAIELADSDEGHRLLMMASRDMPPGAWLFDPRQPGQPARADNECEIYGVKIRWPRGYRMRQDGTLARAGEP